MKVALICFSLTGQQTGERLCRGLEAAGMTLEEEREALSTASPELIREMENCNLYSLLALIPENSPNFKPEYRMNVSGEEVE